MRSARTSHTTFTPLCTQSTHTNPNYIPLSSSNARATQYYEFLPIHPLTPTCISIQILLILSSNNKTKMLQIRPFSNNAIMYQTFRSNLSWISFYIHSQSRSLDTGNSNTPAIFIFLTPTIVTRLSNFLPSSWILMINLQTISAQSLQILQLPSTKTRICQWNKK